VLLRRERPRALLDLDFGRMHSNAVDPHLELGRPRCPRLDPSAALAERGPENGASLSLLVAVVVLLVVMGPKRARFRRRPDQAGPVFICQTFKARVVHGVTLK